MLSTRFFTQLSLAALLAIAIPAFAQNSGSGSGKPEDSGKADDRGGSQPAPPPTAPGATAPDDKGVDPAHKPEDVRHDDLTSSPDGDRIQARGAVEIQTESEVEHPREHVKVDLDTQSADGTAFVVWVNGQPSATITVRNGHGEFQIENEPGRVQPAGAFPVHEIKHIVVTSNTGAVVLRKDF